MAKLILIGLEQVTASLIHKVLPAGGHSVEYQTNAGAVSVSDADIVFTDAESDRSLTLLRRLKQTYPDLPCVVLSRMPDTREWLDALEAGAADYVGAPFDTAQLLRIVEAVQPVRRSAAA
jgi:DNA-binding NtrC family response regulator